MNRMPRHDRWLLVSHSARGLVQSAARAGMGAVVLDLYGDEDTRSLALDYASIQTTPDTYEPDTLLREAERLAPVGSGCALIYGSGFENDVGLLEELARGRILYGNTPQTVHRLKSPPLFFSLLDSLNIPYPAVRYDPPADPVGWLLKPVGSAGGKGIRLAAAQDAAPTGYFQRRLEGQALSVLFLADGSQIEIIGFNTLWTTGADPATSFLFAGALNRADLTDFQRHALGDYLVRLVRATSLKGLNSLDFMLEDGEIRVLEINPRPSATFNLYDADYPLGLLALHVAACEGRLFPMKPVAGPVRAFRVVCASASFQMPANFPWPDWCADRPMPGTAIGSGDPICSILAEGEEVPDVLASITMRERQLLRQFSLSCD